jgi:hypothetical protein
MQTPDAAAMQTPDAAAMQTPDVAAMQAPIVENAAGVQSVDPLSFTGINHTYCVTERI